MRQKMLLTGLVLLCIAAGQISAQITEPREQLFRAADLIPVEDRPRVHAFRIIGQSSYTSVVRAETGGKTNHHNHGDEQIVYVLEGRLRSIVGDREYTLEAGDALIIPSYVPHQFEALEPARWVETHGAGRLPVATPR